jgi:hypothetical protein
MNRTKVFRLICAAGIAAVTIPASSGAHAGPAMSKAPAAAQQNCRIRVGNSQSVTDAIKKCGYVRLSCQRQYGSGPFYYRCMAQQGCRA